MVRGVFRVLPEGRKGCGRAAWVVVRNVRKPSPYEGEGWERVRRPERGSALRPMSLRPLGQPAVATVQELSRFDDIPNGPSANRLTAFRVLLDLSPNRIRARELGEPG